MNIKINFKSVLLSFLVIILLFAVYEIVAAQWAHVLMRSINHQQYIILFFLLLFVVMIGSWRYLADKSTIKLLLVGAVIGYVLGFLSLIIIGMLSPDGMSRLSKTLHASVIDTIVSLMLGVSMLGTWLVGSFALVLKKIVDYKFLGSN